MQTVNRNVLFNSKSFPDRNTDDKQQTQESVHIADDEKDSKQSTKPFLVQCHHKIPS